jgi:RNA polymerase sigma-70 factor (ECF subfamily)
VSSRDTEDLMLIGQVAAGDRQAFEALYHRYARPLASYVAKWLWQPEQVEEVLNDVMLAIWQQAARFDPTMRFSTWLFSIAHHKALTARAQAVWQAPEPLPAVTEQDVEEDPETLAIQQENARTLVAALATLPPEQRAVVELTYYHHRSYEDIAAILGCPVNTVKKRMFLARRRLAAQADGRREGSRPV